MESAYDDDAPLFANISLHVVFDKMVHTAGGRRLAALRAARERRGHDRARRRGAGCARRSVTSRATPALFGAALTHRSAAGPNNERLEFLGDAVLNLLDRPTSSIAPFPTRPRGT